MLQAVAPRGSFVLVGHSMGGMAVLSHARQFPDQYGRRIVAAALISSAAEGCPDHRWARSEKSCAGSGPVHRPLRAQADPPRPQCVAVTDRPGFAGRVLSDLQVSRSLDAFPRMMNGTR